MYMLESAQNGFPDATPVVTVAVLVGRALACCAAAARKGLPAAEVGASGLSAAAVEPGLAPPNGDSGRGLALLKSAAAAALAAALPPLEGAGVTGAAA